MPIPIIQVPDLALSGNIGVRPNLAADNAPWEGLQQTAAGIAKVGEAFAEQANKVQALENTYKESEARQQITKQFSDYETALDTNNEPSTYLPDFDKVVTQTQSFTNGKDIAPDVADNLRRWHMEQSSAMRNRIAERAAGVTTKRASMAIQNELDVAAQYNNEEAYDDAWNRGIKGGIFFPEQRDKGKTHFNQTATYFQLRKAIDDDPITSAEQLETDEIDERYPHLTPENKERLTKYAEQKKNDRVAETWTEIQKASLEGKVMSKEELLSMVKQDDITPAQAASYIRTYHDEADPQYVPLVYDQARSMIHSYDPAKDPTGAVRAGIATSLATTPLPKQFIQELQSQFESKVKKPDEPKHKLATEYEKRIDMEWKSETFGDWFDMEKDPVEGRISRKIIREGDFDKALSYKSKVQSQFDAWLQTQSDDLDPIEAGKQYSEIKTKVLQGETPVQLTPPNPYATPKFRDPVPPADSERTKTSSIGTFGGQRIPPPGMFIRRAATSVFGGKNDPEDNGLSANGGSNNAFAGVAIPEKMLKTMFPGKDKAWHFKNVKVVVRADNGLQRVLPLIDYGTAEWVAEREKNHKLDLNPKAVAALGGKAIFRNGKLRSHAGFAKVDFAITTDNAKNLPANTPLEEQKTAWFNDKKPHHPDQIESGLAALYEAFNLSHLTDA